MSDNDTHQKTNRGAGSGENGGPPARALASTRLDLAALGLDSTVYMTDVKIDDAISAAVYAADGKLIAYAENADEAAAWAMEEGFAIASVH